MFPNNSLPILSLYLPYNNILNAFIFNKNFKTILQDISRIDDKIFELEAKDSLKANLFEGLNSSFQQSSTDLSSASQGTTQINLKLNLIKNETNDLKTNVDNFIVQINDTKHSIHEISTNLNSLNEKSTNNGFLIDQLKVELDSVKVVINDIKAHDSDLELGSGHDSFEHNVEQVFETKPGYYDFLDLYQK